MDDSGHCSEMIPGDESVAVLPTLPVSEFGLRCRRRDYCLLTNSAPEVRYVVCMFQEQEGKVRRD